ncbi:MAG: hypothetical protein JRN67_12385, partial [Nitrososphaerota archaeon]|nr:hypothetical protein [Nitrososphaerota archaeon]
TIPNSVNVVVMSSDGQSAVITVQIPEVNRTTSTTSSSEVPTIKFIESGLPSGSMWTLILNNFQYRSYGNQMVINHTIGGPEEYSVFGPYDQKSFEWAFIPSPQSGTINTSLSTQINLVFSNLSISTPANNLFVLSKPISTTIMSGGSVQLNATYLNIFPEPVQVVVLATATDDNTGSISVATATIEPLPSAEQTAIILFRGLAPGSYTVTLSVASLGGVQLSSATNFTFIIP